MYDIYRAENNTTSGHSVNVANSTFDGLHSTHKQLIKISQQLSSQACLSINLVNICDLSINQLLVDLQNNLPLHQLSYFHVPHYHNVIVHLLPNNIIQAEQNPQQSWLSARIHKRWLGFWQHGRHVIAPH